MTPPVLKSAVPLEVLSTHGEDDSDRSKPIVELHWIAPRCECGGEWDDEP